MWPGRDCLSQSKPILRYCKEHASQLQTNPSGTYTPIHQATLLLS